MSAQPQSPTAATAPSPLPEHQPAPAQPKDRRGPCPATTSIPRPPAGSPADAFMRRMLRVPPIPTIGEEQAHGIFTLSILLSATRCMLTYVIFPIVAPALEAATGAGPAIGIPIGVLALVFDVAGIRRFWLANHRYRWMVSVIYLVVIVLVSALLVRDLVHLA